METERARSAYKPSKINVLFVGESAPAGGTFFYYGNSVLEDYMHRGFTGTFGTQIDTEPQFLNIFKNNGYYLDDLCLIPVNHMRNIDRNRTNRECVPSLAERIKAYKPKAIICLLKSIDNLVRQAIELSGVENPLYYSLPFPGNGNQRKFIIELDKALKDLHSKNIIPSTFD